MIGGEIMKSKWSKVLIIVIAVVAFLLLLAFVAVRIMLNYPDSA